MNERRVLLIGNSHLAAIKLGWDSIAAEHPEIACRFFGATQRGISKIDDLVLDGDVLALASNRVARKSLRTFGGTGSIKLSDFDVIGFVGLQFGIIKQLLLLRHFRSYTMPPLTSTHLISKACLRQTIRDRLECTLAPRLMRIIKSVTPAMLVLIPAPLPSEGMFRREPWTNFDRNQLCACIGEIYELYREVSKDIVAGIGARLVLQPPPTMATPGLSRADLAQGAARLRTGFEATHHEDNLGHMNGEYGADVMKTFIEVVGAAQDRQVSVVRDEGFAVRAAERV